MTTELERRIAELEARLAEIEAARPGRATAWKVTAANGDNWDVQVAYDEADEVTGRALSNVAALPDQAVALNDYVTVVWLADGTPRLFAGGGGSMAITWSLPSMKLLATNHIDLANFTVPSGQVLKVLKAAVSDYSGGQSDNYTIRVWDNTLGELIYQTHEMEVQEGTEAVPLGISGNGSKVVVSVINEGSTINFLDGFVTGVLIATP